MKRRVSPIALLLPALLGCEPPAATHPHLEPTTLRVATQFDEAVRSTLAAGFERWCLQRKAQIVRVEWVRFPGLAERRLPAGDRSDEADVLLGGGPAEHATIVEPEWIGSLPDSVWSLAPEQVGQVATRDSKRRWVAVALTATGLLYDAEACERRGIAPPAGWADLGDPRFFGWIAVADPAQSIGQRRAFTAILQELGWRDGWATTLRLLANSRGIFETQNDAIIATRQGVTLATVCSTSDGLAAQRRSGGQLQFRLNRGASPLFAEVVSVRKQSPANPLAAEFVAFCLSDAGQALLAVRDHPDVTEPLHFFPVQPTTYLRYANKLAFDFDPLDPAYWAPLDPPTDLRDARLIPALTAAAAGMNHIALQQAWERVIDAGMWTAPLQVLTEPLIDEAAAARFAEQLGTDDASARRLRDQWRETLAMRYDRVIRTVDAARKAATEGRKPPAPD